MTARYQHQLRGAAEEPINSRSKGSTTLGLPPEHPTLPSLLREAGYRTAPHRPDLASPGMTVDCWLKLA
jgi:arylsulfatase A-like enzyme